MKNKVPIIILSILFVISSACAVVGFINYKEEDVVVPEPPKDEIVYEYYIEDALTDKLPSKDDYLFSKFNCTDNIKAEFDEEKWKFVPEVNKKATCQLYFVKKVYETTVTVSNGIVNDENNTKTVNREESITYSITPNEGYIFDSATCSDNKEVKWDASTNTLTIDSVTKDVACKLIFSVTKLKFNVMVDTESGTGSDEATYNYGDSVTAVVKPKSGYEGKEPQITCSNGQVATYDVEKYILSIEKLTSDTKCSVKFKKTPVKVYTFKLILEEGITVTTGGDLINGVKISAGSGENFTLRAENGKERIIDCGGRQPSTKKQNDEYTYFYEYLDITSDMTCKVTNGK